jgi:hypothetical protein
MGETQRADPSSRRAALTIVGCGTAIGVVLIAVAQRFRRHEHKVDALQIAAAPYQPSNLLTLASVFKRKSTAFCCHSRGRNFGDNGNCWGIL